MNEVVTIGVDLAKNVFQVHSDCSPSVETQANVAVLQETDIRRCWNPLSVKPVGNAVLADVDFNAQLTLD